MATKLKVNYEFVGDSTTPVTRTESIKHGDSMLNTVINAAAATVNTKADKTYVDTELAKKANAADVTTALSGKADNTTVSALDSRLGTAETNIATQTARIDEIASLPEGSTTGDAELIDIRVGADGKTYTSAGAAVRGQISDVKGDLTTSNDKLTGYFEDVGQFKSTINLFDNVFDESGFYNPSNGEPVDSSGFKRTSKYYPMDTKENFLNILLSSHIDTFTILFYDENKSYVGYDGLGSGRVKQIPILNKSYKYFKIYTDVSYNEQSCISYEWTNYVIVPYGYVYELKNNSITTDKLSSDLIESNNLVETIESDAFLSYTNGEKYSNNEYRTSDYIEIESGNYVQAFYNNGGGVMYGFNAVSGAFYDANKNFISGFWHSTSTYTNCSFDNGLTMVTAPSSSKYVRLSSNDNVKNVKWYFSKAENNICTDSGNIKVNAITEIGKLAGKTIVNFGDSIFGNTLDDTSVSNIIAKETGANVINCGFGGCRMSVHASGWDNCSMYRLSDDIYNNSFDSLVSAVNTGWSGMPGYFANTAYYLSKIDFDNVDVITISYGTNDYRDASNGLDNPSNKFDTSTPCGALRYSIKQIQRKHPEIQILVTSPIFRDFMDISENSDTKSWGTGTLKQYATAFEQACKDMSVHFLDLQNCSGLAEYTRSYYYPSDDGTHPNAYGRERIGKLIGKKIEEFV